MLSMGNWLDAFAGESNSLRQYKLAGFLPKKVFLPTIVINNDYRAEMGPPSHFFAAWERRCFVILSRIFQDCKLVSRRIGERAVLGE